MVSQFVNPDMYHGWHKKSNFFEGWYFKLVDASTQQVFVFIPGMHLGKIKNHSHIKRKRKSWIFKEAGKKNIFYKGI